MTRILTEGAEMGDKYFWDARVCNVHASAPSGSGSYSYQISNVTEIKNLPSALSEFYYRERFVDDSAGNGHKLFIWRSSGGTELGSIRTLRSSGIDYLAAYTSTGTLVATGAIPYSASVWYIIEVYVKIADSGGRIVLKFDGIIDINYTGDTKPGADTTVGQIAYNTGYNSGFRIDDIALNDTSGGSDNGWCGDGHIIALRPNGNGDSSQFVGSDGNSTDNYLLVDEAPPNGSDYTQSPNVGEQDLYNFGATGLTNVSIRRIWPEARAIDTVAEGAEVYLPIKTNSIQYDGTAVSLLTSYTKQLRGDVRTINPDTTSAWQVSELDALQAGIKVK